MPTMAQPGPVSRETEAAVTWSVTINDLPNFGDFPEDVLERFADYRDDMYLALTLAEDMALASCTLSGGRMPGIGVNVDNEMVDITIRGNTKAVDFNQVIKESITRGPDQKTDQEVAQEYFDGLHTVDEGMEE